MVTRFYHTRDPIANLRVRVTVRKIAVGDSRDGGVAVGTSWSDSFLWQEKKWPFKPLGRPRKTKPAHDAATEERGGADALRHGIALCSYVDADNYEPPRSTREAPTTSVAPPPHVAAAAADYHLSKTSAVSSRTSRDAAGGLVGSSNRDRVALRAHREETFRQMHVVLHITDADDDRHAEDLVLASIRFYPHTGLLCMTPGFSVCVVDDKDAHLAEKGPKLSTYRVVSRTTGAQFEYALDNENELWPVVSAEDQRLLRELQRQEECEERARVEEWRNKHGDAIGTPDATASKRVDKCKTEEIADDEMMVLLEIVSVSGIDAPDPIRVVVELITSDATEEEPGAWKLSCGKRRSRSRLSCVMMRDVAHPYAAFGHHIRFMLKRRRTPTPPAPTARSVPPLKLTVLSMDGWGREHLHGYAEMRLPIVPGYTDTEVALWRPLPSPQAQMEAFFLGYEAEDASRALTSAVAVDPASKQVLTRLGARTVSTNGRARVRYHVVQSWPSHIQAAKPPPPPSALSGVSGPHSGGVVKRSVEEILESVKASQFSSRGGSLAPLPVPSPNVTAILARLKDQSSRVTSPSAG